MTANVKTGKLSDFAVTEICIYFHTIQKLCRTEKSKWWIYGCFPRSQM